MATTTRFAAEVYRPDRITEIQLPRPHYVSMLGHVIRKLTGHYLSGETPERKAFGMLTGRWHSTTMAVSAVFPLLVNLRQDALHAA